MTKTPTKRAPPDETQLLTRKSLLIEVEENAHEANSANYAQLATSSHLAAYRVMASADGKGSLWDKLDVPSLVAELKAQKAAVNGGDLSHAEGMLINQAIALQSLFVKLTERGMLQDQLPLIEGLMKLALRAQNQCRATLETLAAIKHPTTVFTKQANFAAGHQQINNGTTARVEKDIQPNELLSEGRNYAAMDSGRESAAIPTDQAMATLGA